jgi:protein TonB
MNAFALHESPTRPRSGAGALRLRDRGRACALIALAMNWYTQRPVPGVSLPAIMVDMAPVSSAPQPTQMDLAPGPVMQQADASPPEPAPAEAVQEEIARRPPQEKPDVVAPPEQKVEMKPRSSRPRPVPEPSRRRSSPKVVRPDAKKPTEALACAANDGLGQGRAPGAGRVRRQRRRIGAALASYRRWSPPHCSASSNTRRPPKSAGQQGHLASQLHAAAEAARLLSVSLGGSSGHSQLDCRDAGDGCAAPSRFPAFPAGRASSPRCRSRAGGVLYPVAERLQTLLVSAAPSFGGISKLTVLLSITWCVGSASFEQHFVRTWFQPNHDRPFLPLASTKCHGASSTVMWT